MEEIGARAVVITLEGLQGEQRPYIEWLLGTCKKPKTQLDDLEPRLIRYGYDAKALASLINVRPAEIRSFLHSQLPPGRTQEVKDQLLEAGEPL